jgi:hypothetical protein
MGVEDAPDELRRSAVDCGPGRLLRLTGRSRFCTSRDEAVRKQGLRGAVSNGDRRS